MAAAAEAPAPYDSRRYVLPATARIPNSQFPLVHYKGVFASEVAASPSATAAAAYARFAANGWRTNWIFRYGDTQRSHYHRAHECMVVLTGTATIRFGVADTADDLDANTHGHAWEDGGLELQAEAGDVFLLPAGLAHKTYATQPRAAFQLLTPGDGHSLGPGTLDEHAVTLRALSLDGYTMMGCYPADSETWDFRVGGEDVGHFEDIWSIPVPALDPVFGDRPEGIRGTWQRPS
ncbi:hypothetical protein Sste5346_010355 [Sporothrix stenoceras]|uniref:Cupin type-1 domain-containing protein n=1 Tax=Sporothrix stenoceras TaxID=5173 RepID=A0ABR3YHB2_9PEZI